jgi:uncharacterized BrkB/YihY/UPF0761 family membrane protein
MDETATARIRWHLTHPLPLFEQLVLRTESHAYCGSLAFFALMAFYPLCLLLLVVSRSLGAWVPAETVLQATLREYYPEGQAFLLRNLQVSVERYGREMTLPAVFWVLLGAAGVFVPLETAFNQLWSAKAHRPYWRNQAVGLLLTGACCALAFLFVVTTAALHALIGGLPLPLVASRALAHAALRLTALSLSVMAIFLFYRFLPNTRIPARSVFPAAVVAGVFAEAVRWLYLQFLPLLELVKSQGPYYVSISFVLLVYFEAFVLLGGAFIAARPGEPKVVEAVDPSRRA